MTMQPEDIAASVSRTMARHGVRNWRRLADDIARVRETVDRTMVDGDVSEASIDTRLENEAHLIANGVRPMSMVNPERVLGCPPSEVGDALDRIAMQLEVAAHGLDVIPFAIARAGAIHCGFSAERWTIDLLEWLVGSDAPDEHYHRIIGLMLGYSPRAVRIFEDRTSGRRVEEETVDE